MPTVKTMMDEKTYRRLVRDRKSAGLPSVSALFLKNCGVLSEEKEAAEIVRSALRIVQKKDSGFTFKLRGLFPAERWDAFTKGARLRAGRMFHAEIAAATRGVRLARKTGSNHQLYEVA